jgi:hypothetical protein
MEIRWPEGRWLLVPFTTRFGTSDPNTIGLVHGIMDLFFPAEKAGAAIDDEEFREARHS